MDGVAKGFTASSFTPASLTPPLVLTCLSLTAECFSAFESASWFAVNVLGSDQENIAEQFAFRGADKFGSGRFVDGPHALPLLEDALTVYICKKHSEHAGGDHLVIIGEVSQLYRVCDGMGLVHFKRKFWSVGSAAA